MYLVYGAREPGNIRVVQLNESSGGLPGHTREHHHIASGPSFQLGQDSLAGPFDQAAVARGRVRPQPDNTSLVENAFVLPVTNNGNTSYFLFVDWFGGASTPSNESLVRVLVGRSTSPVGPYYDRLGNDMKTRQRVVLGGERLISIDSGEMLPWRPTLSPCSTHMHA